MNIASRIHKLLGRSDIYVGGSVYMKRWRIISTPWFGIRIHNIMRSDADPELHDHPFSFLSLILRGSYIEDRADGSRRVFSAPCLLWRKAETLHRLDLLVDFSATGTARKVFRGQEKPVWTLVIRGPIRREWGFRLSDGTWQHWKAFVATKSAKTGERNGAEGGGSFDGEGSFAAKSSY